jgi:NAD(P)-dependent dehydrogenase (short-subunit alcohol dehydrogenase family)
MAASLRNAYTQMFPPAPTLTEDKIPSQAGKVFIVTGGSDGIGFEIVKTLYSKGAKIYMASRSQTKAETAIKTITALSTATAGEIKYLHLDLSDLSSVRTAAGGFGEQEEKLDVLWNNAAIGVGAAPNGSTTKQGHAIHVGTNCLGPFLFTQLLLPKLKEAVKTAPKNSVRIVWASSLVVDGTAPKGGVKISELASLSLDQNYTYTISKAGNWLLASEFARRVGKDGIVSITQNPGNLNTRLLDNLGMVVKVVVKPLLLYPAKMGGYTNLWAGLSPEVKVEDGGRYVIPWGRWHLCPRKDITDGFRTKEEGGTGEAAEFWKWCKERTKEFVS